MSSASIPSVPPVALKPVSEMGLGDLERLRLILRGGSVIDWRRMHFVARSEVDEFLSLCGYRMDEPLDEAWGRVILADAVEYLRKTFHYRVTAAIAHPEDLHDLFLFASGMKDPQRLRKIACIVLK